MAPLLRHYGREIETLHQASCLDGAFEIGERKARHDDLLQIKQANAAIKSRGGGIVALDFVRQFDHYVAARDVDGRHHGVGKRQ
jgi:hypothetical protein